MKVLVTGGTGYIGSAVCERLKAAGHAVTALTRSEEKAPALRARGYEAAVGSVDDPDVMYPLCIRADAVIHTAFEGGPNAGLVDAAAVELMLQAMAGSAKPLVYTSGIWVYGDTKGRMVGEVSPLSPPALVAWRPSVEEAVLAAKPRGIQAMVFRPGVVFGRQGGTLASMFGEAREAGVVRYVGDGQNHWSWIHVDDLIDLYLRAVTVPFAGELFIATGGMPHPVRKVALAVAKQCGIEGKVESIPFAEARLQMGSRADCLVMDQRVGSTKAARFFGWTVRKPSVFDEIFSGSYQT